MGSERTRIVVEVGLTVALAAVLNMLKLFHMPQGGTVSFVMLPLVVLALRRGLLVGLAGGLVYGFVDLMIDGFVVHWIQLALDYPVAYGLVGLAGLLSPAWRRAAGSGRVATAVWTVVLPAVLIAAAGRYGSHLVSGAVFFGEYAPDGQPVWVYSALYNLYVPVSAALAFVGASAVLPVLSKAAPTPAVTREARA